MTVKSDGSKLGLRDRDYLRTDEIEKIKLILPNLKILLLSTFENYIYHPDNIYELGLDGFEKDEYKTEIIKQKNNVLLDIVGEIGVARSHYIEFKDCIVNDLNIKPITSMLKSDNFDDFYAYFNMKKHFNKRFLSKFKYNLNDLATTNWFKNEILKILVNPQPHG